jgi:hypothetical protein
MKFASRSALMACAILSLVFCLATPVAAQKDEGATPVAQEDEAAALAARAAALQRAGKYSEAIPLEQQVLAIREKQLGPDHPDVERAIGALAFAYQKGMPSRSIGEPWLCVKMRSGPTTLMSPNRWPGWAAFICCKIATPTPSRRDFQSENRD